MRAREFITEQRELADELSEPMRYTYVIPGLSAADPYNNYRFGVAMARARSDAGTDDHTIDPFKPEWSPETAFGEHGVVVGMNSGIEDVIDKALAMTKTPGGKELVSTADSREPEFVDTTSPVKAFKGYPR
jgi:hypothetical protein